MNPAAFFAADRRRLFWQLQLLGWGGTLLISAGMGGFIYWPAKDAMILGLFRSLFGFAATSLVLRPIYRKTRASRLPISWKALTAIWLLCGLLSVIDTVFVAGIGKVLQADLNQDGLRQFLSISILIRWVLYGCWSLLYFGIHYWLDTQEHQLRMAQTEAALRSSELQLLRSQVNPHFLFNALNSILAEADNPSSVKRITLALADYLRFSLKQRSDTELLGVELSALENYLCVEKARFEEKLDYRIEHDDLSPKTRVPVALIQPLLENAVKFGQRSSIRPLHIAITCAVQGDTITVRVKNSGEWCEPEEHSSTGTGLANLRRRLHLLYGEKASLSVEAGDGEVTATVALPSVSERRP